MFVRYIIVVQTNPKSEESEWFKILRNSCSSNKTRPDTAVLVAGQDEHHNFQLLHRPEQDFGEKETKIHQDAIKKLGKIIMS